MRTHKKSKCSKCSEEFVNLELHLAKNHPQETFQCSYCDEKTPTKPRCCRYKRYHHNHIKSSKSHIWCSPPVKRNLVVENDSLGNQILKGTKNIFKLIRSVFHSLLSTHFILVPVSDSFHFLTFAIRSRSFSSNTD